LHLDTKREFGIRGPDECFWHFKFEKNISDYRGVRWGWRAYRGSKPVGWWKESEVLHRLVVYGQKLDNDGIIDLGLALKAGALEEFLAANRLEESPQGAPSSAE